MKKIFLSVAILATVVSCSKNDVVDNATPKQNQIGFSTLNDKVSSRAPSGTAGLGYTVYAQYTTPAAGTTDWYVKAVAVTAADVATGAPFWPELSLDFYAYAAHTDNISALEVVAPATTPAAGTISFTYTVNSTASEDFTVATPVTQQYSGSNSSVSLEFQHMLSRVMVSASLAETMVTAKYKLDLTAATTTTLTVVNNTGEVNVIVPAITAATGAATYVKDNNIDAVITTKVKSTAVEFLIMPHADTDYCTVTITGAKLTHATNQPIAVTLTKTFDVSAQQAFKQGTQYNLNFEVSLTQITFTSTQAAWNPVLDVAL